MARYFLTDALVRSATCQRGKSQEFIWDYGFTLEGNPKSGSVDGLGFRISATGDRSFVHAYKFNGKRRRVVIGQPPNMTVAAARLKIQQRLRQLEDFLDPEECEVSYRDHHTITLREVVDMYYEQHLKRHAKTHCDEFRRMVAPWVPTQNKMRRGGKQSKQAIKPFGLLYAEMQLMRITPQHVGQFLHRVESDSKANAVLRQLKAMFNWAIRMQLLDMRNPCTPFRPRKIIKQRRDYTPDQVREIALHVFNPPILVVENISHLEGEEKRLAALRAGQAAQAHAGMLELCAFMGILFLTMARPIELKRAEFTHFDLDNLIWHKHNTKGLQLSRATYEYAYRSVPIHAKVAELVRSQRARWPESDLLFPNHLDQTRPRDNFNKALNRFRQLDGVPDYFQLYDLKRMAISLMIVGQGVRREDVSHYVDHKGNLETTMIYDLGFVDPMRPVTDKLGELLGI